MLAGITGLGLITPGNVKNFSFMSHPENFDCVVIACMKYGWSILKAKIKYSFHLMLFAVEARRNNLHELQ